MRGYRLLSLALIALGLFAARPAAAFPGDFIPYGPWWRNCASLDLDFYNDRYFISNDLACGGTNPTTYSGAAYGTNVTNFISGTGATFTRAGTTNVTSTQPPFYADASQGQSFVSRASSATYFDSTGTLQTASANTARSSTYSYNGSSWVANAGTLIEPAATNQIRNNTATGATAGTPGTPPTDWSTPLGTNQSSSIIGTGTENGISYVDIQLTGTSSASGFSYIFFDQKQIMAALKGQTWTGSVYVKLVGGSLSNITMSLGLEEDTSNGAYLTRSATALSPTSASLDTQQVTVTRTFSNDSAAYSLLDILLLPTGGASYSVTLRIGMPQLEQSPYATSVIPTSGSAATRAADVYSMPSGGTYFNAAGTMKQAPANTPRLDHDPSNSAYPPRGILIEESRTNQWLYSSTYNASYWVAGGSTITGASAITAPDGTSNEVLLVEDTSTGEHTVGEYMSGTANVVYTFSVFVKSYSSDRNVQILVYDATDGNIGNNVVIYNPSTQSVVSGSGTYNVQALANDWSRISVTFTPTVTKWTPNIKIINGTNYSYTGDGTSGVYVWGAQVEAGAFPTSYIPTSGSAVTRAADVFTIPTTAGGGWYNSGVGTLMANATIPYELGSGTSDAAERMAGMDDGTASNGLAVQINETSPNASKGQAALAVSGSLTYNAFSASTFSNNTVISGSIAYNGTNAYSAFNATGLGSSNSAAVSSSLTELDIGMTPTSSVYTLNGWLQRVTYFPIIQPSASLPGFTR